MIMTEVTSNSVTATLLLPTVRNMVFVYFVLKHPDNNYHLT